MFWKRRPFGETVSPACEYCARGMWNTSKTMVLCQKHGVVRPDYFCRRFDYDPLLRVPKRAAKLPDFPAEDFRLDD